VPSGITGNPGEWSVRPPRRNFWIIRRGKILHPPSPTRGWVDRWGGGGRERENREPRLLGFRCAECRALRYYIRNVARSAPSRPVEFPECTPVRHSRARVDGEIDIILERPKAGSALARGHAILARRATSPLISNLRDIACSVLESSAYPEVQN
jgi:hypothetical protein